MAASLLGNQKDWSVDIPEVEEVEGVTFYKIKIRVGMVKWETKRRFKEFAALHSKLVSEHGIAKDTLPPKRLIKNKEPEFVERRRADLESYLTAVVSLLYSAFPDPLVHFLDIHKHDVIAILQQLLADIGKLDTNKTQEYTFQLIQVHAISERLKLPCPPVEMIGFQHDFSAILDFCAHLQTVTINGGPFFGDTSNIVKSSLKFELSPFRNVVKLILVRIDPGTLTKADDLRKRLVSLTVIRSELENVCDILLCDTVHRSNLDLANQWPKLLEIDFSLNKIEVVDNSLSLTPNIETLTLNSNMIHKVLRVDSFNNLLRLNLSKNNITSVEEVDLKLPKLLFLDLSQNRIVSLRGLECFTSLRGVNLSSNKITQIEQLDNLTSLKNLEYVVLTGNPISTVVDYRVKILEKFGQRASKICLDNEQTTQQELDKVAVLQAIRFVKEGKSPKTSTFVSYPH